MSFICTWKAFLILSTDIWKPFSIWTRERGHAEQCLVPRKREIIISIASLIIINNCSYSVWSFHSQAFQTSRLGSWTANNKKKKKQEGEEKRDGERKQVQLNIYCLCSVNANESFFRRRGETGGSPSHKEQMDKQFKNSLYMVCKKRKKICERSLRPGGFIAIFFFFFFMRPNMKETHHITDKL